MKTKRGQKWLCGVGTLTICAMLTGCGHEHTWREATCTEPRTCSECSKTKGEALGHTWVDATCKEPKTCSVCGEIEGETLAHTWLDATCSEAKHCSVCGEVEGEPLEHTLTGANYQQAATCEICGATVGEPLQADFEKFGLTCDAEQNKEYYFSESRGDMLIGGGRYVFSDYEIFDSDDNHEALEGYEWRVLTVTFSCNSTDAYIFNDEGIIPLPTFTDYYCDIASTYNESTDTYTLNYNGVDYTDVKVDREWQSDWNENDDILTIQARFSYRVPKGYDGIVATIIDASKVGNNETLTVSDQVIYYDNEFFRLK